MAPMPTPFKTPRSRRRRRYSLAVCSVLFLLSSPVNAQTQDGADRYLQQIKPILSNKCYTCHGPDENTREGGIRFDIKESAFGEGDSGEIPIVPGKPNQSELLARIHASDDSQMPPADQEKQLTDAERDLLRDWITEGAPWEEHWAFVAPDPSIPNPDLKGENWVQNPIDAFVLQQLDAKGMKPSKEADRATLIRRLYLDLTGLPPTPKEVEKFLRDDRPNAYEKIVDRLLASPHYGEHMASAWLDAARFADTNGYQNDFSRKMWPWRDWVINAYNDNMPFDQFTIEQIAGDMLPNATLSQKIASGFNRNNRSVTEGGSIEEEWHVENVVDRVETTATVFMGLTMGCARCHDHKYDPISQREFYEFYAFFNNSMDKGVYIEKRGNVGPLVKVDQPKYQTKIAELQKQIKECLATLKQLESTLESRQTKWSKQFLEQEFQIKDDYVAGLLTDSEIRPNSLADQIDELGNRFLTNDSPLFQGDKKNLRVEIPDQDNSHIDLGQHFVFDGQMPFTLSVWAKPDKYGAILSRMDEANDYRGFDLLLMPDGRLNVHLIHKWPVNAIKVTTIAKIPKGEWTHLTVTYDGSQKSKGLKVYIDSAPAEYEVNNDSLSGTTLTNHPLWLGLRAYTPRFAGGIAEVRRYDRVISRHEMESLIGRSLKSILKMPLAERTNEQAKLVRSKFRTRFSTDEIEPLRRLTDSERELAKLREQLPTTMVMQERLERRPTYLLRRGQYDQPDRSEELTPGIPKFLPQLRDDVPKNRLGLAYWLVDPENPLTARVTVNRFWQHYFGTGIIETSENFGVQSPLPTHPKLLDWLATEFVRREWNVKAMQKLIVMSATYRQSSATDQRSLANDASNQWLSRGPRFRLSAESIRDNALAISGLLTRTIGGESIKPYQPEGVWKELAGGAGEKPYVQDQDDNLYRRSLYIYRKRTVPHPTMSTFDAGSREICQVSRHRTNTPLQALALLNDETYVEAARALAIRCLENSTTQDDRLIEAFYRATCRRPNDQELSILRRAMERYEKRFAEKPESAQKYLKFGELPVPEQLDRATVAAMTVVCSTILNLDETITKE